MIDSEILITALVVVTGTWSFLRVIGKDKHRRERILEVLQRRKLRDLKMQKILDQPPDES